MKDWGPKLGGVTLMAFASWGTPSHAGEWTIDAVSTVELNIAENRALRKHSIGTSVALISDTALTAAYVMHDGEFNLSTDLKNERYLGEASADGVDSLYPHFSFDWTKSRRNDTFTLNGSYRNQRVTLEKILDQPLPLTSIDRIPVGASETEYQAGIRWLHTVNALNSLSLSSNYNETAYSGDEVKINGKSEKVGIDNTAISNDLEWNRKVNRKTDLKLKTSLDWLQLKDASSTDRFVYAISGEITRRLNARLTAVVGGGFETVQTVVPSGTSYQSDYTFDAGLEYRLNTDTFSWNAHYGINQSALGDLAKQASTSVAYKHQINDNSSFSADATLTLANSRFGGGLGSNWVFRFTPTYNLALTRDWDFAAGYRFNYQSDQFDAASSTVFMSLTRDIHIVR